MKTFKELEEKGLIKDEREKSITDAIPFRFKEADLEKCHALVKDWAYQTGREKRGLYLYGPVGTGKTYAAYAIYRLARQNGNGALIANSTMILQDIKDDFTNKANDPYYRSKFDAWVTYKGALIIDDIGSEKPTEWVLETFYTLINARYEENLPTIFTSNLTIEELAGRLGDRIASRIVEMCEVKKLDGIDRRLSK